MTLRSDVCYGCVLCLLVKRVLAENEGLCWRSRSEALLTENVAMGASGVHMRRAVEAMGGRRGLLERWREAISKCNGTVQIPRRI